MLFGWVKHFDDCLMILQLPAQIMLSLLTQAHKKMFHISGRAKGVVAHQRGWAKRGQAEQSLSDVNCSAVNIRVTQVRWAVVGEPPHGVTLPQGDSSAPPALGPAAWLGHTSIS